MNHTALVLHLSRKQAFRMGAQGFSLIELMIALTIGLLLSGGIIFLFSSTSRVSSSQEAVARLQENGRYAMSMILDDLRMARGQYCSNTGGASVTPVGSSKMQDSTKGSLVYSNDVWGYQQADYDYTFQSFLPLNSASDQPYWLSPRFFMQGYECTDNSSGTCYPIGSSHNSNLPYFTSTPSGSPDLSWTNGNRQRSRTSDVLTVRYLASSGWPITNATCNGANLTNVAATIPAGDPYSFGSTFTLDAPGPAAATRNDIAMIASCQDSSILAGAYSSGLFTAAAVGPGANFNRAQPQCPALSGDLRLFNFTKGFVSVSYYLQIAYDTNPDAAAGRMISRLIRRVNGQSQVIADGVERLDFLYVVENKAGNTRYLTAREVHNLAGTFNDAQQNCPPPPIGAAVIGGVAVNEVGCLWQAVKAIEVRMLVNTVNDISLDQSERQFTYDGVSSTPLPTDTLTSGLPAGRMLRREFTALVSVRNYNP